MARGLRWPGKLPRSGSLDGKTGISRHHVFWGLVPGAMLAYRMGQRDLLVAVAEHYDESGRREHATLIRMPPDEALRGRRILIVDEVWESGRTLQRVAEAAEAAGAAVRIAVLHYKPSQSETTRTPDHYAETATGWVIYPYKGGE